MKKILIAMMALIGSVLAGCNDWLDVSPRTEVKKDALLETQKGFRDMLTGAYIRLKDNNLYGGEMTWGTIEYLAQHWETTAGTTNNYIQTYNYSASVVKDRFTDIFKTYYKVIADVNSILEEIDGKKNVFTKGNYELVKGEALTLRAFCHLDVLRLFGPMPSGDLPEGKVLPYVKTVTNEVHDYSTYDQFVGLLFDDLNEAEKLLGEVDPILKYSIDDLKNTTVIETELEDDYWGYRQIRANYYGVLALKARLYLWTGDKTNAALYANKVIDATDPSGKKMWTLADGVTVETGDWACASENILGLSVYDLDTKASDNFDLTGKGKYAMEWKFTYYVFNTTESAADIRFNKQWVKATKDGQGIYICKKYNQPDQSPRYEIPLIRLGEMYFIAMEAASTSKANELYTEYASRRGVSKVDLESDRVNKLKKEFNKEFYAEGQMFYFYKRTGATSSLEYVQIKPEFYVAPLPEREILFNNK